jgi:heme exporter protein D
MYWASFAEFLTMGGYAGFVWPAYAIAVLVLGGLGVASGIRLRAARSELAQLEKNGHEDA